MSIGDVFRVVVHIAFFPWPVSRDRWRSVQGYACHDHRLFAHPIDMEHVTVGDLSTVSTISSHSNSHDSSAHTLRIHTFYAGVCSAYRRLLHHSCRILESPSCQCCCKTQDPSRYCRISPYVVVQTPGYQIREILCMIGPAFASGISQSAGKAWEGRSMLCVGEERGGPSKTHRPAMSQQNKIARLR